MNCALREDAMADRTVHASYDGMEIVRYDRAGKWYLEPTNPMLKRQAVTISQAVSQALWAEAHVMGRIFLGRSGGKVFDAKVRGDG
jgi:hypothetical protein